MTEVDINFIRDWPNRKIDECCEWLVQYPRFGDIDVDEETGIMKFTSEEDATFFILRWR